MPIDFMLSAFTLGAVMLNVDIVGAWMLLYWVSVCLDVSKLSVIMLAECHFACWVSLCLLVVIMLAECNYTGCLYAGCCYTGCHYAKCL
jgi:hypothetical protein